MGSFFSSTEFYVMATMAAATVIGLCVKPPSRGPAVERLLAGTLCDTSCGEATPCIVLTCEEDGTVLLTRTGLQGLTSAGAVSLAATKIGTDITIEERITHTPGGSPIDSALFTLDIFTPGRYHIRYNSSSLGLFAAFILTVRPGNSVRRPLRQ
ncbi:MAG: hypothetical protein NC338_07920 [Firmicutes bacterium]|nr:hypothetical protein [Bacillota bacterium]MCM1400531.1 hypothetical protein [Bacteroides sp.]MCM1476435.1 hypothetical protein [Bacteroides sp.]